VGVRHAVTACAQAAGAGAVLSMSASGGSHEPVFATDRRSDQLEDLQATLGQGPSADVIGGAGLVLEAELAGTRALARWPQFASAAMAWSCRSCKMPKVPAWTPTAPRRLYSARTSPPPVIAGPASPRLFWPPFDAVHAVPMRLREQAIGAMNLFSTEPGTLDVEAAELGQALADVATISILHERAFRHHEVVTQQLQNALSSRIVIEQAKGVLAERLHLSIEDAFTVLLSYARSRPEAGGRRRDYTP